MNQRIERINIATDYVRNRVPGIKPVVGIVLGSGLGKLAEKIENPVTIPYKDIPGFPISTAIGHKGNLIYGDLGGRKVIAMQGRIHFYEGYTMDTVTLPIRVMAKLGIQKLFVSNAAGGCNPKFAVGDMMIIDDHINLLPNPLIGPNIDEFGKRFHDMTCAYDRNMIAMAEEIADEMGLSLKKGVYLASSGPSYETPAEVRYFRMIGADAVGMSTIPEVVTARHCGIDVFGMSVITNMSNTETVAKTLNDGDDVVLQADRVTDSLSELFLRLISRMPLNGSHE